MFFPFTKSEIKKSAFPNPNSSTIAFSRVTLVNSSLSLPIIRVSSSVMRFLGGIRVAGVLGRRTFAAGGAKAKKGKGGAAADGPRASIISKEIKSTTVFGANILKDGQDPKVLPDSEYPDWLWRLLDKRPALSELRRKEAETLPYDDLKRLVKLDNRARIKENNSLKAKN